MRARAGVLSLLLLSPAATIVGRPAALAAQEMPDRTAGLRRLAERLTNIRLRAAAGDVDTVPPRWHLHRSLFPDFGGQTDVGLLAAVSWERGPDPGPEYVGGAIRLEGMYGISGSRSAALVFEAPGLASGWRLLTIAAAERLLRTPYFGVRNDEPQVDSLEQAYGNRYYRYALLRTTGLAVVQRRLAGPVWLHLGGQARHYRTAALEQTPTLYRRDAGVTLPGDTTAWNGLEGRAGLLFDTRNERAATGRGVLLQAVAAFGRVRRLADDSTMRYRRYLFDAREFFMVGERGRTVVAVRQHVALADDTLPFFLAWEQVTTWRPGDGVAGSHTMRLRGGGDRLASNQAIVSVDVRHKLLMPRDDPERPVRLWGQAFVDVGTLWERGGWTARHDQWTVGTGFRIQLAKGDLTGVDFGVTDLGINLTLTTYFAF